jgi:alpha-beta hydrolase superfamily lysophospholipase
MSRVRRLRTVTAALPVEVGRRDGLAYTLWLPERPRPVRGGVVILHGAGSRKESHHDFARVVLAAGFGAVCFDARGHGDSDGRLDGRAATDVAAMADLLRERTGRTELPVAIRGSSMGGYLALVAARAAGARAVVAICPAPAGLLRRGLQAGAFEFEADPDGLVGFLASHDLEGTVDELQQEGVPVLIMHAEGDERVPVQASRELAARFAPGGGSRLVVFPGGHHRSIQHDRETQALSLRFLERALGG